MRTILLLSLSLVGGFSVAAESTHGRPLANWNEVHQIELICEPTPGGKVALNRMGWVRDEVPP